MAWTNAKTAIVVGAALILAAGTAIITVRTVETYSSPVGENISRIVPGTSVGKVMAGMSTDELLLALGQPATRLGKNETGWDYPNYGLTVISSVSGVAEVICGDASGTNNLSVKACKARTEEGVGMGSTRSEIVQAFDQPETIELLNDGREQLQYKAIGLTLTLKEGKVIHIIVDFPSAAVGMVSSVYFIKNNNLLKNISDFKKIGNTLKDESDQHALMRYFKLKGIKFTSPPKVTFDEQNGLVKINTSKMQTDEINIAMGRLMSGNLDAAR